MSECSGPATVGVPWRNHTGSCGVSINGLTLKIHEPDEDGNGEVQYSILWDILCNSYTCKFCAKLKKNGCKAHFDKIIKKYKHFVRKYGWSCLTEDYESYCNFEFFVGKQKMHVLVNFV